MRVKWSPFPPPPLPKFRAVTSAAHGAQRGAGGCLFESSAAAAVSPVCRGERRVGAFRARSVAPACWCICLMGISIGFIAGAMGRAHGLNSGIFAEQPRSGRVRTVFLSVRCLLPLDLDAGSGNQDKPGSSHGTAGRVVSN